MGSNARLWLLALGLTTTLGCGRTEALWWADVFASESGTSGDGDGDSTGDGDGDSSGDGDGDFTTSTESSETETGPFTTETSTSETTASTTSSTEESTTEDTDCPLFELPLELIAPRVVFLADQGSHMSLNFGGPSRWQAIGQALFDEPDGLAWSYEDQLAMGFTSFTHYSGAPECPALAQTPVELANGAAMQFEYSGQFPSDDNPVANAIDAAAAQLANLGGGTIMLFTGRNPDTCDTQDAQASVDAAIAAAEAAFDEGVELRLFEVGNINNSYAQNLANAGSGSAPGTTWDTPPNAPALRLLLDAQLGALRSCELDFFGPAFTAGGEAWCSLTLDGELIPLDEPEGWTAVGPAQLRLLGDACDALEDGAEPAFECSCEAFDGA